MVFRTAEQAFLYYANRITLVGDRVNGTRRFLNVGFTIEQPLENTINVKWRDWSQSYADREWEWYLSQNRSVEELKKHAKIWDSMHNGDNIVNSNYGYQWNRNNQLQYVVDELTRNPYSRRAVLTLYDGKEHEHYAIDTPCTLNIVFNIINNKLNMNVLMRSNDLWFGFCNDQYSFSKLQQQVANSLQLDIGNYFHFANDLHIYDKHYDTIRRNQRMGHK